jgi:type III secretion protein R
VALTIVGLLPFLFMALTAFVKISTVLSIAKSAIGAQGVPSNTVVLALGAALTLVAMAPVGSKISNRVEPLLQSEAPWSKERISDVVVAVREPLRDFLRQNAAEKETRRFVDLSRRVRPEAQRADVQLSDFTVVIPAFLVTELGEAFALGFAIFLPFLILDLVIGNVLLALGMQTLSVSQVSLPFKLLLFVAADGWGLLAQTLISGYQIS